jgi:dihydrofolate reductase
MNLIAAVDRNWAIGRNDELLFRIRADLRRFKEITKGNIVICGRRTVQTFPGGKPLAGRINLIMSRQTDLEIEDAVMCRDKSELFAELKSLYSEGYDSSQIYMLLLVLVIYRLLMHTAARHHYIYSRIVENATAIYLILMLAGMEIE